MGLPPSTRSCFIVLLALAASACIVPWPVNGEGLTVSISQPWPDDIVAGNVTVKGTTSGDAVVVEVRVDSGNWSVASGMPSWTFLWNATPFTDGKHIIEARAVNGSRTSPLASVSVTVNNTPPASISFDADVDPSDPIPGEDVHVSGIAEFDSGSKASGITVSMRMDGGGAGLEWQAMTDDRGLFEKMIKAPSDAGDHVLTLDASARGATGHEEFHLMVTSPYRPDLAVDNITVTPATPRAGENASFEVFVSNKGTTIGNCTVKYLMDGKTMRSESAAIDKSYYGMVEWTAATGDHVFEVRLEDIKPLDLNGSNDKASLSIRVLHRPDLAITGIIFSNPMPEEGDDITVRVGLRNVGEVAAIGKIKLYRDVVDPENLVDEASVDVAGNDTADIYIKWRAAEGRHTMVAVAIITDDQSAANDRLESDVIVVASSPDSGKGQEVPGFGTIAALAGVLVALAIARRGSMA